MRPTSKLKNDEINKLRLLVDGAKANVDKTRRFLCKANISARLKNIRFAEYYADNFCITPINGGFKFCFYVNAIDKFEAEQQALERLYEICAFLSVETNIHCSFKEFSVSDNELLPEGESANPFIEDYIDNYPAIENWQICISSYAYKFIREKILLIGRFEKRDEIERYFISACKHLQIGIESELKMGDVAIANTPLRTIALVKRDQKDKIEHMTSALMSYLSAVECATITETNPQKCKECGATIYKIAYRVRNVSAEFLGDYLGKVFYKLYAYRSKFLHAGKMASDANTVRTIPLLSESSETGVKEFGNVSIKVDGNICSLNVSNIREWTTYILRCYYQKRILGRMSFAMIFEDSHEITLNDFPLKISAVSPEGGVQMQKIFVKTDTIKYKLHVFFTLILTRLKRFYNRLNGHDRCKAERL